MPLRLQLVTPTGQAFDEEVAEVLVPTTSGTIGVLPRHTNLTTVTKLGIVSIRRQHGDPDSAMDHYVVTDGIAEIDATTVRILVDEADHAASLDEHKVNQDLAAARERLRASQDKQEIAHVTAAVEHNVMRTQGIARSKR